MEAQTPVDPLAVVFSEAEARAGTPLDNLTVNHTQNALDAYDDVCKNHPQMEMAARGALAPLVTRVLRDAAAAGQAMRGDPAAPGLEREYHRLQTELGGLAAVYVTTDAEDNSPDPSDPYAGEYLDICAGINSLMAASQIAKPTWDLLRT